MLTIPYRNMGGQFMKPYPYSVCKRLSKYGEKFTLRYHIPEKEYHLSQSIWEDEPMLIAVYDKTQQELAYHTFELLEKLYHTQQEEINKLKLDIQELNMELSIHVRRYNDLKNKQKRLNQIKYGDDDEWLELMNDLMEVESNQGLSLK